MERKLYGQYIVADPEICHGKLTFIGTRILVADVLADVGSGMSWDTITYEYYNHITKEAIAEAIELARQVLLERFNDAAEPLSA
jgi:uncharacterized protein (DUF433 family)